MGKALADSFPDAASAYDEANEALGFDLRALARAIRRRYNRRSFGPM